MARNLIIYAAKIKSGKDCSLELTQCSFELPSLETIEPLLTSNIIEAIFQRFDNFTIAEKKIALKIIEAASKTVYRNVIYSNNFDDLMKVLQNLYTNGNEIEVLLTMNEYLEFDENITEKILKANGINMILDSCKTKDTALLNLCSLIVLRIVMFGGKNSVNILMKLDISSWILPFVRINNDCRIKYYAYFTLVYLRIIWNIKCKIFESGMLDSIVDFLFNNEIELRSKPSIICRDTANLQKKLLGLLSCKNRMAQTFGVFQIAWEISSGIDKHLYFNDERIIRELRRVAVYSNVYTSKFAKNALIVLTSLADSRIVRFPPKTITEWDANDVQRWLKIFGFEEYAIFFQNVDGVGLMAITDYELKKNYFLIDGDKRKLFYEERSILSGESSGKTVKILQQQSILYSVDLSPNKGAEYIDTFGQKPAVVDEVFKNPTRKKYDAFISYRRQGGSELASLIYINLVMRNYNVFFDVRSLCAGKFAEKLKTSIQQSRNFILLLTPDALKRCKDEGDWIALEIEMAIKSECNIVPIAKDFDNNDFDDETLPKMVRHLKEFNQIMWHHDAQVS